MTEQGDELNELREQCSMGKGEQQYPMLEAAMTPERLLTPKEVGEILGVSRAWVLDHASRRRPHLPSVKLGKAVRFRKADVEEFIVECVRLGGREA